MATTYLADFVSADSVEGEERASTATPHSTVDAAGGGGAGGGALL